MPGNSLRQDALSPAQLATVPDSLIGSGERVHAGLPPRNALIGQPASSQPPANALAAYGSPAASPAAPGFNALTGQTTPALPPPPPVMPDAAAPALPAALPGQEHSTAVGRIIGADKMSDADLATQLQRHLYIQNAIRLMFHQGQTPTHGDVLDAIGRGVKDGILKAPEAGKIMGGMTDDPARLPAELDHRAMVALHASVHLAGEKMKRDAASKPVGAS